MIRQLHRFVCWLRRQYFETGDLGDKRLDVDEELKTRISQAAHAHNNAAQRFEAEAQDLRRRATGLEQLAAGLSGGLQSDQRHDN